MHETSPANTIVLQSASEGLAGLQKLVPASGFLQIRIKDNRLFQTPEGYLLGVF